MSQVTTKPHDEIRVKVVSPCEGRMSYKTTHYQSHTTLPTQPSQSSREGDWKMSVDLTFTS